MKQVDKSSLPLSFVDPYYAKIHKLNQIGIVIYLVAIIAGITAIVLTIIATDLKYFPVFVTSMVILFICFIGTWILQKKIDIEEAKSRQDFNKKWAILFRR